MINAITNYAAQFMNAGNAGGKSNAAKTSAAEKNFAAPSANSDSVEISEEGRNALVVAQNPDATKLSDKAQNFLDGLREKYGDYDFVVSANPSADDAIGGTKAYSVIFTPEELERMADDEDYAQKMMGNVGKAVDTLKDLSERDLGEGVQFSQLSASIDDEGNMKFFAQLEKLSAEQQERLEAARERRAEENDDADDAESAELTKILYKPADVEADTADELLAKIFGIDWDAIAEEEAEI